MQIHNKTTSEETTTIKCDDCGFAPPPLPLNVGQVFQESTAFWDRVRRGINFCAFLENGHKIDCCANCSTVRHETDYSINDFRSNK